MNLPQELLELARINHPIGFFSVWDFRSLEGYKMEQVNALLAKELPEEHVFEAKPDDTIFGFHVDGDATGDLLSLFLTMYRLFPFHNFSVDANVSPDVFYDQVMSFQTAEPWNGNFRFHLSEPITRTAFKKFVRANNKENFEMKQAGMWFEISEDDDEEPDAIYTLVLRGNDLNMGCMDGEVSVLQDLLPIESIDVNLYTRDKQTP